MSDSPYSAAFEERLEGGDRTLLIADESIRIGENDISWRRCVLCDGGERVSRVNLFESDQRALDAVMPTDREPIGTLAFDEVRETREAGPVVRGNIDDPRV